jgi:hypothetical protein
MNLVRNHLSRKKLTISVIPQASPSVHDQHPLATFLSLPTRLLTLHFLCRASLRSHFAQLRSFVLPEDQGLLPGLLLHASSQAERA